MSGSKQLHIRFSEKEKIFLDSRAKVHNMNTNQYVRYKLLEVNDQGKDFQSIKFLDIHLPLIVRTIIDGYCHIRELASQQISAEALLEVEKEAAAQFKALNISKISNSNKGK